MKQPTIAIIGAGSVGATTAYALILKKVAAKIVLIDINEKKCEGEIQDLIDAVSIEDAAQVSSGSLRDAAHADIIIITAGAPQKPGQTRLELLKTNIQVIDSLMQEMKPLRKNCIIIVVTNPVDILTRYVQDVAGLERNRVFGSGTFLDTQRLRGFIAQTLHVNAPSVHAYVLGEHGDNQIAPWSIAEIGSVPIAQFPQCDPRQLDLLAQKTKQKAYDIIACKGFTNFGIATAIAYYCESILGDLKRVLPVSCYSQRYDVCMSLPAVIGAQGVEELIFPPLSDTEEKQLRESAQLLRRAYEEVIKS